MTTDRLDAVIANMDDWLAEGEDVSDKIVREWRDDLTSVKNTLRAVSGSVAEIRECGEIAWQQGGPCQLAPGTKLYAQPVSGSVGGEVEALRIAAKRLRRLALECPLGSAIRDDACEWAAEADAAIIASAPTAAPQVDGEWVLVPRELPRGMWLDSHKPSIGFGITWQEYYDKWWSNLLAAAPTPAQSEPPAEGGLRKRRIEEWDAASLSREGEKNED